MTKDEQTRALLDAYAADPPQCFTPEGLRLNFLSVALTDASAAYMANRTAANRIAYESAMLAAILGGLDVDVTGHELNL